MLIPIIPFHSPASELLLLFRLIKLLHPLGVLFLGDHILVPNKLLRGVLDCEVYLIIIIRVLPDRGDIGIAPPKMLLFVKRVLDGLILLLESVGEVLASPFGFHDVQVLLKLPLSLDLLGDHLQLILYYNCCNEDGYI